MRVRYGIAAAFAAAIAAVLLLRHEGYLHGRVMPGPLRFSGGGERAMLATGETRTFLITGKLDGDPVHVESVKPHFASPGLEILGPRSTERGVAAGAHWPPRAAGPPLRGHTVAKAESEAVFGLRATARGVYYVHDMSTLYKRGSKSFASRLNGDWCITIGHGKDCAIGYVPPPHATVTEWGGPSRYGVPIRKAVGEHATTATYPSDGGRRTIAITLSNLTNTPRTVSHLGVKLDVATISQPASAATTIPPHQGRRFLLDLAVPCRTTGGTAIVDRLRADADGTSIHVPLSVALAFRSVSAC